MWATIGGHRHPNLLANSRVIQAFCRLAAARGALMETRCKDYRIEAYQTENDDGAHVFADWTGVTAPESSTSSFPRPLHEAR
jgi:hypothetical protein